MHNHYRIPESVPRPAVKRKSNNVNLEELLENGFTRSLQIYNPNDNTWTYTGKKEVLLVNELNNGTGKIIQRQKRTNLSSNYK